MVPVGRGIRQDEEGYYSRYILPAVVCEAVAAGKTEGFLALVALFFSFQLPKGFLLRTVGVAGKVMTVPNLPPI